MKNNLLNKLMNFFIKTSSNLYLYWNIGSLLMMFMMIQIIFGFMLSMHYFYFSNNMFINSFMIFFNFNYGWMMRFFHSNMTSMIFILIFFHITRSLIYKNYMNLMMWNSGILMILILMMISFMGYSLIMNQMSYWASMVITNFLMVIPILGKNLMLMIWGNKFIDNILLNRFFSMHFMMAMLLMFLSMLHLIILHKKKSSNPLNLNNNIDQINLNPLFIFKDMLMFIVFLMLFLMMNMFYPIKLNNYDNFNKMMIFKTPSHIEPEWYFLFFYAILRSNKNKLNGLMIMILSILIWFFFPLINKSKFITNKYLMLNKFMLMMFLLIMMLITFIGTKTSKEPYIFMVKKLIIMYFLMIFNMYMMMKLNNL